MKFDKEISLRTAVVGLIMGLLASERLGLSAEAASILGAFSGALYDLAWFWAKKKLLKQAN